MHAAGAGDACRTPACGGGEPAAPAPAGVALAASAQGSESSVRISLCTKAVAGGALILLLSAAAIAFSALDVAQSEMRRAHQSRIEFLLETTAQGIASSLAPVVDADEIGRALRHPVLTDGVLFCACFDAGGALVGCGGVPEFDEPVADRFERAGPVEAGGLELRTRRGDRVTILTAPVVARASTAGGGANDSRVGTILLGFTRAPVEAAIAVVRRRIGTIVLGVGGVAALLTWLVARLLVRPIHELVAGTERIALGDFDQRVTVRTRDELALLAGSFNAMTAELADSRDRLARQTQILEETVRERTRELRDACAELQVLDKMKDGFLSSISHELRTPITSIRAFAEILHQDPSTEPGTRQEFAEIIVKESDHLSHLVSDLLDLVTIESGEVSFRFARLHPAELARAAARQVEPQAREKEVTLDVAAAPDLPSVFWDGAKITRLVVELLDNAVRFAPAGGRAIVTVSKAGEQVRIEVRDDGPGIPHDGLESIFDRFRQSGEVLTGKPRGQGLGLAICRVIAQRHGGSVRAAPAPRGAHLVADLPIAPALAAAEPRPEPALGRPRAAPTRA